MPLGHVLTPITIDGVEITNRIVRIAHGARLGVPATVVGAQAPELVAAAIAGGHAAGRAS